MDISVVILTYNEKDNIRDCLESILRQKYSKGLWEIVVVDGNSKDTTVTIVNEMQKKSNRIRLISNAERKIAPGRNIGISESKYPFIAFTDADCVVPIDWLEKLSGEYKKLSLNDTRTAGVGGGNVPPAGLSLWYRSLGIYLNSFLGSFNSPQGRLFLKTKKVVSLSCANVLYNKEALKKIGGFDAKLGNISEDFDINYRLTKQGYNLYFVPDIYVIHKLRPTLFSWLRNVALYGQGRAAVSFKHNLFLNIFFILPLLFSIGMLFMPLGFFNPVFLLPLLYFPTISIYVLYTVIKKKQMRLFFWALVIFISTHFVYAYNLLIKSLQILTKKLCKYC